MTCSTLLSYPHLTTQMYTASPRQPCFFLLVQIICTPISSQLIHAMEGRGMSSAEVGRGQKGCCLVSTKSCSVKYCPQKPVVLKHRFLNISGDLRRGQDVGAAGRCDKNRNCIFKVSISPTDTYLDSALKWVYGCSHCHDNQRSKDEVTNFCLTNNLSQFHTRY